MNKVQKKIGADMLVQSSEKGQEAYIGRVVGLKHHRFVKLSKQDMLDGKRRYIPLAWVKSVRGKIVHLDRAAAAVRGSWLDKAEVKADRKAQVKAASTTRKPGD